MSEYSNYGQPGLFGISKCYLASSSNMKRAPVLLPTSSITYPKVIRSKSSHTKSFRAFRLVVDLWHLTCVQRAQCGASKR